MTRRVNATLRHHYQVAGRKKNRGRIACSTLGRVLSNVVPAKNSGTAISGNFTPSLTSSECWDIVSTEQTTFSGVSGQIKLDWSAIGSQGLPGKSLEKRAGYLVNQPPS